jgi:phosphonate transport system substrate-binding protein
VQAQIRSGGKVIPIAQRKEDTQFRSVFITQTDSGIKQLSDLKGKQVSFGSQSSTSGHLMPRSFLLEAGIDPDKDFKRVAYSGAHDATIASVVSGRVDAAALDITVWRKFVDEKRVDTSKVNVFYTTPRRPTSTTTGRRTPTCPPRSASASPRPCSTCRWTRRRARRS